jgi:pimeloyl-ACP methyl ester carboxylesterase
MLGMLTSLGLFLAIVIAAFALALVLGRPKKLPPMASINDPFKAVDFSLLPPLLYFAGRDGTALSYRHYAPVAASAKGSAVLVHGSSASSNSMHVLATALAAVGYAVYALDMRGHGASGRRGTITYIGQLEDDIEAFLRAVVPAAPATLAGFSAGGGFVLRFAGSARQDLFQSYVLLSPFLGPEAANYRPGAGGWVSVGVLRLIAVSVLNSIGIRAFNNLPITQFALCEEVKTMLTPTYSYPLALNFRPQLDLAANIEAVHQPCAVVAGAADEAFKTDRLEGMVRDHEKNWPVILVPDIGHIELTLKPAAVAAVVRVIETIRAQAG